MNSCRKRKGEMSERGRLTKNAGFSFANEIISTILTMAGGIITARYLGAEQFGVYSYAMSVVWVGMVFTDLGISTLLSREIARDHSKADKYMSAALGLRVTSGLVLMLGIMTIAPLIGPAKTATTALRLMSVSLVLVPMGAYFTYFRATERLDLAAIVGIISKLCITGMIVATAVFKWGINGIIGANLFGYSATAILVYAMLRRTGLRFRFGLDFSIWKQLALRGLPFFAMSILSELYNRIDQILIPYLDSVQNNGLYGVAARLALIFVVVPNAVSAVVFPYFSRRAVESIDPLRKGMVVLYRYLSILGLGALVFIGIPAEFWIKLLFGSEYLAASGAMRVLFCAIPMLFICSVNIAILYALEKQFVVLRLMMASLLLDVLLDLLLIPRCGFIGAAYASLATNIAILLFSLVALKKTPGLRGLPGAVAPPIISAAVAGAVLFLVPAPTVARIGLAAAVYLIALILTGGLGKKDMVFARELLVRTKTGN